MEFQVCCPICSGTQSNEIQSFKYSCKDHEKTASIIVILWIKLQQLFRNTAGIEKPVEHHVAKLSLKQRTLRKILFEKWCADQELLLKVMLCSECGFVWFSPRPTETDMRAKYNYFKGKLKMPLGEIKDGFARILDKRRAKDIYQRTTEFLPHDKISIMDFGGGDGRILLPFVERGHKCSIVDFNEKHIPGVIKIADEIYSLKDIQKFDLILCCHVLEHLVNPVKTLGVLRNHLTKEGTLFIEIPNEIWGGINRIATDPVTHCNFMTRGTLDTIVRRAGFVPVWSEELYSTQGHHMGLNIRMICKVGKKENRVNPNAYRDVLDLLHPSYLYSLTRLLRIYIPQLTFHFILLLKRNLAFLIASLNFCKK